MRGEIPTSLYLQVIWIHAVPRPHYDFQTARFVIPGSPYDPYQFPFAIIIKLSWNLTLSHFRSIPGLSSRIRPNHTQYATYAHVNEPPRRSLAKCADRNFLRQSDPRRVSPSPGESKWAARVLVAHPSISYGRA